MAQARLWFDAGAAAFARVWPDNPYCSYCYACPLCLDMFTEDEIDTGRLTREHVPPASIGGKRLVLTCFDCNSRAGDKLDASLAARTQALDFTRGTLARPAAAGVTVEGGSLAINLEATGTDVRMFVVPEANNPRDVEAVMAAFDRMVKDGTWDGFKIETTLERGWKHLAALCSALRAAYLAAFAALGYTYILDERLAIVRKQIDNPDEAVIPLFHITVTEATPSDRLLLLVREPQTHRSLFVQMGRAGVFLPHPFGDDSLYDRLAQFTGIEERVSLGFSGDALLWPKRPMHALDTGRWRVRQIVAPA